MADLADGESIEVQGSGRKPYLLQNTGGVYSCSCPAWRNQSLGIERRTCKHLRKLRGDEAEKERIGSLPEPARRPGEKPDKPPLLLAHRWENDRDLTGWWMSEKLDGVRAYWDGKTFLSRLGNRFIAPDWFTAGLPGEPLDGELWVGRKQFQKAVGIVRRQDAGPQWQDVRFLVFDAPQHDGEFERRLEYLGDLFGGGLSVPSKGGERNVSPKGSKRNVSPKGSEWNYAELVRQEACSGIDHMRRELARVEERGGEGLMLREPGSLYEQGRSMTLLKVKTFFDAEARVVSHSPGRGRHKGRLGALEVVTLRPPGGGQTQHAGVSFSIGTGFSDAQRGDPPPAGSIVTYRYQELTDAGVPRFPSFIGVSSEDKWPQDAVSVPVKAPEPNAAGAIPVADAPAAGTPRRLEFVGGSSSKFWQITVDGARHRVRYGRIGTDGQSKEKTFADPAAAERAAEKLVAAKLKKGYEET